MVACQKHTLPVTVTVVYKMSPLLDKCVYDLVNDLEIIWADKMLWRGLGEMLGRLALEMLPILATSLSKLTRDKKQDEPPLSKLTRIKMLT